MSKLSQSLAKPKTQDLVAAKHVLRYLKGTVDYELCFRKTDEVLSLMAFSDSDWASSVEDRRSTTGYCFSLTPQGPAISWKSRKQPTVALSTCEAEYIGLANTTQESMYLTQLHVPNSTALILNTTSFVMHSVREEYMLSTVQQKTWLQTY